MSLMQMLLQSGAPAAAGQRALAGGDSGVNMSDPTQNPFILVCHLGMAIETLAFLQGDMFWLRVGLHGGGCKRAREGKGREERNFTDNVSPAVHTQPLRLHLAFSYFARFSSSSTPPRRRSR